MHPVRPLLEHWHHLLVRSVAELPLHLHHLAKLHRRLRSDLNHSGPPHPHPLLLEEHLHPLERALRLPLGRKQQHLLAQMHQQISPLHLAALVPRNHRLVVLSPHQLRLALPHHLLLVGQEQQALGHRHLPLSVWRLVRLRLGHLLRTHHHSVLLLPGLHPLVLVLLRLEAPELRVFPPLSGRAHQQRLEQQHKARRRLVEQLHHLARLRPHHLGPLQLPRRLGRPPLLHLGANRRLHHLAEILTILRRLGLRETMALAEDPVLVTTTRRDHLASSLRKALVDMGHHAASHTEARQDEMGFLKENTRRAENHL